MGFTAPSVAEPDTDPVPVPFGTSSPFVFSESASIRPFVTYGFNPTPSGAPAFGFPPPAPTPSSSSPFEFPPTPSSVSPFGTGSSTGPGFRFPNQTCFGFTSTNNSPFLAPSTTPFGASPSSAPLFSRKSGQPPYDATVLTDEDEANKIVSISKMPASDEKSHEELRGEDYQLKTKAPSVAEPETDHVPVPFGSSSPFVPSVSASIRPFGTPSGTPAFGFPPPIPTPTPSSSSPFAFPPTPTPSSSSFEFPPTPTTSSSSFAFGFLPPTPTPCSSGFVFGSTGPSFPDQRSGFGLTLTNNSSKTPFGSNNSPFGASPFSAPLFSSQSGQPPYGATVLPNEDEANKIVSISKMPASDGKSHEELRWEDYQLKMEGGNVCMASPSSIFAAPQATTPGQPCAITISVHCSRLNLEVHFDA